MTGSYTPRPERDLARLDPMFPDDSDLGRVMADWDWAATPVGPPHTWSPELRSVVRILLTSRFSMWMGWGPELSFFYNDAYRRDTLRAKHPWALGRPFREVWAEILDEVGPRVESVMETGVATWDSELLLMLNRSGFREETYHTFSYSPLLNEDGSVAGLLCVVTEDTDRVLVERRLTTLRDLASAVSVSRTRHEVLDAAEVALARDDRALPFTLTYLFDPDGTARLAARTGIPDGHPAAPPTLTAADPAPAWPVRVLRAGELVEVRLTERFGDLPTGAWAEPPERAVAVPFGPDSAAADGFLVVGLNRYRPWDGQYRDFLTLLASQLSAGLTAAGAFEDERRRAEGLAELDRAKTDFFSNVSHEFRTPLTLIMGPVQDLRDAPELDQARVRTELAAVHRNAQRLGRLVDTLLEFSRLQSGRVAARFEPTDLARLTGELAGVFRSAVERAGLTLDVSCEPLSGPVLVDREMWEKVVLNLLSNAVKFTAEGGITVALRQLDGVAELAVTDTGCGVPAEELPRLFERFHRVRGARARSSEGTGIGLAMVRELVGLHGGRVTAESEPDVGTRITVTVPMGEGHLPAEQVVRGSVDPPTPPSVSPLAAPFVVEALGGTAAAAGDVPAPSMPADPLTEPRRVLVADDNADMRAYLGRLLSDRYLVDSVADGETALARALADPPDLVVADIMMPGLDGMELLAALRADTRTSRVPVLLLSARAGQEAAVEGLAAGADDYLVKPFSAAELLARVGAHVQLGRLRREAEARFTAMADLAPALIWLAGPDGARVFFNSGWREYTGREAAADLGDGWWDAVHPQDRDRYREVTEAARAAGEGWAAEYRLARADGTYHWLLEHAAPIAGGAGGHVGSCTDINARYRESERQRLLADVATALDTVAGPAPRMQRLTELLVRRRLADVATVVRVGRRGGADRIALAAEDPEIADLMAALPAQTPASREVARTLRPVLRDPLTREDVVGEHADEAEAQHWEAVRGATARSAILLPLVARGRLLAILGTTRAADSPPYTGDDMALLEEVAERAGMGLENALLLAEERDTAARLAVLQGATAELSAAATPDQVAAAAITHLRQLLGADTQVFVYEYEAMAERLAVLGVSDPVATPLWGAIELDATLPVARAFRDGKPVWVRNADDLAAEGPELRRRVGVLGVRAFAALPLVTAGGRVGAVVVGFTEPRSLTATERATLLALAEQCAQALDRARLYRAEHRIADTLQRSLLPAHLPRPERLALAAQYLPGAAGTQAGGDWYDVIELDAQRVAIAVGDVVGQGPAAAAVMGRLSAALSAALRQGYRPAAALELLDNYAAAIPGAIASTALCLTLDTRSGELRWARAGHLPPLVLDDDATRFLDDAQGHGPTLGLTDRPPYTEGVTTLRAGATLLAFTDGLVERRGEVVDEGLARLRAIAEELSDSAPTPFLGGLLERLTDSGPPDDIAAVCARLLPESLRLTAPARAAELGGIRRRVRGWAARLGLSDEAVTDLVQTVDEVAANSVEHAYPDPERPGTVSVTLTRRPSGAISARVTDQGRWRTPPDDPGFRGHGLRVVGAITEDLTVRRSPGGTDIEFTLPPRESDPSPGPAVPPLRYDDHRPPRLRVLGEDRYLLIGDLDRGGADELRPELLGALSPGREVSLRLGTGCYLSSSGAALLAEAVATAADGGGRLHLVATDASQARRALDLIGMTVERD